MWSSELRGNVLWFFRPILFHLLFLLWLHHSLSDALLQRERRRDHDLLQ